MAVLNKIRQRSFFLIIIIALALFSFVLADLFRSGGLSANGLKAQKTIGNVNGDEIKTSEFQTLVDNQSSNRGSKMQQVQNIWNQQVNTLLIGQRVDEAGIVVNREHISSLLAKSLANDPTFQDENGQFDNLKMQEYVANVQETDPQAYKRWKDYETNTEKLAAQNIYFDMIKAGVGTTAKEGELAYKMENDQINIQYVQLPYTSISDSLVSVSKSEIASYIKDHENEYSRDAYTDIEYVKIDEVATLEDELAIKTSISELLNNKIEYNAVTKTTDTLPGLASATNIEEFVNTNSAIKYNNKYNFKSGLVKEVAENLFDAEIGKIYGPYKDAGYIKLSKLVATTKMPDSVKASHILVSWKDLGFAETERTKEEAKTLADSIQKEVSKKGSLFSDLATKFSADTSNKDKGGDLGYFTPGRMVPAFNDYVFENKTGSIGVVETQFGYHVIRVEDQKNYQTAVKIATVAQKIEPSEKTINDVYAQAIKFESSASNGFTEAAKEANLSVLPITKVGELDANLPSIGEQRQIVRWAFDSENEVGSIKKFDLPSSYIIARLTKREEKGTMNVEEASAKVLPILRNKKKAVQLIAKVNGTDLDAIAKENSTNVKSASAITMKNASISGTGIEKKVVGTAFGLEANSVSKPIEGVKGVYVVKVVSKTPGQGLASYQGIANKKAEDLARRAPNFVSSALKKLAEIVDRRSDLY